MSDGGEIVVTSGCENWDGDKTHRMRARYSQGGGGGRECVVVEGDAEIDEFR